MNSLELCARKIYNRLAKISDELMTFNKYFVDHGPRVSFVCCLLTCNYGCVSFCLLSFL